jgi:hypothetical protein
MGGAGAGNAKDFFIPQIQPQAIAQAANRTMQVKVDNMSFC